jgi:hypothetical protein
MLTLFTFDTLFGWSCLKALLSTACTASCIAASTPILTQFQRAVMKPLFRSAVSAWAATVNTVICPYASTRPYHVLRHPPMPASNQVAVKLMASTRVQQITHILLRSCPAAHWSEERMCGSTRFRWSYLAFVTDGVNGIKQHPFLFYAEAQRQLQVSIAAGSQMLPVRFDCGGERGQ